MNWNLGKHKVAWQAVFWLAHILLASMLYTGVLSFKEAVPRGLEQSIFHAIIVYGNLFGIYPYFLKKRGGVLSYLCVGLLFSARIALCQFNLFAPIINIDLIFSHRALPIYSI